METHKGTYHGTELTPKEAKEFEEAMANMEDFDMRKEVLNGGEMNKKGDETMDCQRRLF